MTTLDYPAHAPVSGSWTSQRPMQRSAESGAGPTSVRPHSYTAGMAPDTLSFNDSLSDAGVGRQCWLVRAMNATRPLEAPFAIALPSAGEVRIGRGDLPVRTQASPGGVTVHVQCRDERMSSSHATMSFRAGAWQVADAGSKNGTFVNGTRVSRRQLRDGDRVEVGVTAFVYRDTRIGGDPAEVARRAAADIPVMRTVRPELAGQLDTVARIAASPIRVLVRGETGTGKELMARAVHELSGRSGRFVAVNCGALPRTLVESQLFGYVKGAFSGAERDTEGLVRAAAGGTLFLDEIAELTEPSQVALLRFLEEGRVLPLGATEAIDVDVRVVAATHQDLERRIDEGAFREDLFARIAGAVVQLPPLRERREDLGLLVAESLRRILGEGAGEVRFDRKAARALFTYDWPRNARELRAALELALTNSEGRRISLAHLPAAVADALAGEDAPSAPERPAAVTPDMVREALKAESGNVSAAARRVGYSRAHFNRLLKRFDIDPAEFRG